MKELICFAAFVLVSFNASAQYQERDSNRIGIGGGVNQFTLNTSAFDTQPETGWNVGVSVRGNFYNDFDMVYGIQFSENNFMIEPASPLFDDVKCKISSAQISLLLSYKLIESHLSIELGPMLQVNGKIDMDDEDQTTVIDVFGTTAEDIQEISTFNFYPTVGITAGIKRVRLNVYYQYGVNDIFGGMRNNSGESIDGHAGILGGNIIFYL